MNDNLLDKPVVNSIFSSPSNSQDSVIDAGAAASVKDSRSVVGEVIIAGIDGHDGVSIVVDVGLDLVFIARVLNVASVDGCSSAPVVNILAFQVGRGSEIGIVVFVIVALSCMGDGKSFESKTQCSLCKSLPAM